jgi:RimJ/RimL family protein N-acetyltransferase
MDQPEIAAGRWLLRPWRRSDVGELVRAWADPEILRWSRYGAQVPERADVEQWVDWNREQWQYGLRAGYAVCPADDSGLAGSIMLRDWNRADAGETGYWVAPDRRGQGAASSALAALSAWAFDRRTAGGLGLRRIVLRHSVRNLGSCRVARRAGFVLEGTMRESFRYADGDWHDEHLHARLVDDPAPKPLAGPNQDQDPDPAP